VELAKAFYSMLGWRLDADVSGDEYRLVQFTPPGSACPILCLGGGDLRCGRETGPSYRR
jgi:hypothetical protein